MEDAMDLAQAAVDSLECAWNDYLSVCEDLWQLEEYLNSAERRADIEADEAGILPKVVKRGVLSEDGLWDLLEKRDALLANIRNR